MALKTLFNEVEFLAEYPMVGLAITDSTGPVPGYLFGEINAITFVDNGSYCKILVSFLVSRLKCDTPIVCIKILKLLLYLVKNGHSQVTNEVRLHEVPLKEARYFNGPADDIYGNSFYQMIRKMSKELLELIFSENIDAIIDQSSIADQTTLTGYGSQASSKKMTGFGYNVKTEKSVSDVVSDSFNSFVEKLFPSPDRDIEPLALASIGDSLPKYKPIIVEKSQQCSESKETNESSVKSLSVAPKPQRKVKVHRPGRAGGGWESSSDEDDNNVTPPLIVESSKDSIASIESIESSKLFVECASDISDECKIVDEFTVNKPLNELNYSDIQQICKRCSSLNCDEVLSLILKKVNEMEEFIQLRALVFIEYLLFHDVINLEPLIKIVLPNLQKFLEEDKETKSSVKIKTMKICKTIEILNNRFQQNVAT